MGSSRQMISVIQRLPMDKLSRGCDFTLCNNTFLLVKLFPLHVIVVQSLSHVQLFVNL